ncbi:hypothetical protein NEMBOFW57_000077 [Staphylotrichum longicolle]|uniref:Uncharacterized protein n=1 Tax=Staphylotrichum longicolle TaxID=669026 RepID=A0AAD4EYK0_9PEZI|nr:hypothetical protein NEMBOFW57_000077 [Staphylotrichum longicolle]
MEVQLEPLGQGLEQYGPWHFGDARFQQDQRAEIEAALLRTATIPGLSDRLLEISKASRADCPSTARPEVTLSVTKVSRSVQGPLGTAASGICGSDTAPNKAARPLFPTTLHPSLAFAQLAPAGKTLVAFPLSIIPSAPRPCLKRRRPDTDVDGHNTSVLGCKKRRLLRHLITSRLSEPFSLPATHILNREAVATGDKRFLKLAAIMSARRLNSAVTPQPHAPPTPQQPSPSTWLRRAAVLNSLRSRVCAEAAERGTPAVPDIAAKAAAFQQTPGATITSTTTTFTTMAPPPPPPTPAGPTVTRLRIPSPQLRPLRSPELRVTRPLVPLLEDIEDLDVDDGSMAFPTSEHESRYYEDDSEDDEGGGGVYADFSVIFGGGGNGEEDEDDAVGKEGECFEDYMDEVDGIPWGVRF